MSSFVPEPVRDLFAEALGRVPRPLDKEVIARVFQLIEGDTVLRDQYRQLCGEYSQWTVNKFGGMAVRDLLGWDKEIGNPRPAIRFTVLVKTYTRLVPPSESGEHNPLPGELAEGHDPDPGSSDVPDLMDTESLPEIRDWVTPSQAAEILGITRSAVHKKMTQREFQSVHRLGERPYLVILRSEVERLKARRKTTPASGTPYAQCTNVITLDPNRPAGKTTVEQFLANCSAEERDYFARLFGCLESASIDYWMGVKGFSASRVFRGYPTFGCNLHGMHLRMDYVPARKKDLVRELIAKASGRSVESIGDGPTIIFDTTELPVETVCAVVQAVAGRE
jgi:hypothetical protein